MSTPAQLAQRREALQRAAAEQRQAIALHASALTHRFDPLRRVARLASTAWVAWRLWRQLRALRR